METGTAAGAGPGPANGADTSAGSGTDVSTGSAPAALSALSAWSASSALSAQSGGGAAIALHGATRRLGPFTLGPLDMGIPTGMVTGFIGPDGAGKTTAIKAMLGCCPWIPGRSRSWGWTRFVGPLTELTESWAMARGSAEDLSPAARAAMTGCRVTVHGTVEGLVRVSDRPLFFFALGARRTGMLMTLVMWVSLPGCSSRPESRRP